MTDIIITEVANLCSPDELAALLASMSEDGREFPFVATMCRDRADWLEHRKGHIGASSAGTVLGLTDAWKTRKDLWEELAHGKADGFTGNAMTEFGNRAEPLIRAMYALEHPELNVYDGTGVHLVSKARPWMAATLDAVTLNRESGELGILEIKTSVWKRGQWGDFAPDNYMAQVYHQMSVTGFRRAVLLASIRSMFPAEEDMSRFKTYLVEMCEEVKENMDFVVAEEAEFWKSVEDGVYSPKLAI